MIISMHYSQNMKDGQTAIFHVAVKGQGCVDLVEKMVQQGANPNIQDAVSIL
jgi:ankyrin repeat protein